MIVFIFRFLCDYAGDLRKWFVGKIMELFSVIHMYKQALLEFWYRLGFVLLLEGFFGSCPLIYMEICILLFVK